MIKDHIYMWIWGMVCVSLFILMTAYGFKYKKIIPYKNIEKKMIVVAKDIEYKMPSKIDKVTLKQIKKENKLLNKNKMIKNCTGKVTIKRSKIFKTKYKAYLNCKNYKTSNIFS